MEGYWLGTSMLCPQEACSVFGVCDPDKCFNASMNQQERRLTSCQGCRLSTMLYSCPPGHCTQVQNNASSITGLLVENVCREGHTGPACARCKESYAMESGLCVKCIDTRSWGVIIAIIFMTLFLFWLYFYSYKPLFSSFSSGSFFQCNLLGRLFNSCLKRSAQAMQRSDTVNTILEVVDKYKVPWSGFLKVSIGFWQVSGSFMNVSVSFVSQCA